MEHVSSVTCRKGLASRRENLLVLSEKRPHGSAKSTREKQELR